MSTQHKLMRQRAATFILAWSIALSIQASPVQYNLSGTISHNGSAYETFTGSFVLSDPTVLIRDYNDSRGNRISSFVITDFTLTSANNSLYQTSSSRITLWWVDKPGQYYYSWLDSSVSLSTSGGSDYNLDYNRISVWNGDFDTQPSNFSFTNRITDRQSNTYSIIAMAEIAPVPLPAATWLLGSGLLGLIGVARKKFT